MKTALVLTNHLNEFGGSEVLSLEVAEALECIGYRVDIYSNTMSEIMQQFTKPDIRLITAKPPVFFDYDVVWMQHLVAPLCNFQRSTKSRQCLISTHLSPYEPFESVGLPLAVSTGSNIVSNSHETHEHILDKYPSVKVENLYNACSEKFTLLAQPDRPARTLEKVLIISNHIPDELTELKTSDLVRHIQFVHMGKDGDLVARLQPEHLEGVSAVISIGKSVQNALLYGLPVYVYDHFGGPGWLSHVNFEKAEKYNFSGRCSNRKLSTEMIARELIEGFDAAVEFAGAIRPNVIDRYSIKRFIEKILNDPDKWIDYDMVDQDRLAREFERQLDTAKLIRKLYCFHLQAQEEFDRLARNRRPSIRSFIRNLI